MPQGTMWQRIEEFAYHFFFKIKNKKERKKEIISKRKSPVLFNPWLLLAIHFCKSVMINDWALKCQYQLVGELPKIFFNGIFQPTIHYLYAPSTAFWLSSAPS
jgi:hypothetical protein